MVNKVNFNLNIPNNIWMLLLIIALVLVLINRCNKEGFGYTLDSSSHL